MGSDEIGSLLDGALANMFDMGDDSDEDSDDGLEITDINSIMEFEEYHLPDRAELEIVTPLIEKQLETMHKTEVQEKRKLLSLRASLQKQWKSNSDLDSDS